MRSFLAASNCLRMTMRKRCICSVVGNFDCRITLDKAGPIHDVVWGPISKEFGVVYDMPAKTVLL
ncbi:hypothetical protein OG21DRAFT_1514280 [Imleria badia]|nr:hypothetical protein OG21DRAFT_1514280 [Imleria badia]